MIEGHSDIEEPIFVDFIRQLYDDLVRLKNPCRAEHAYRRCPDRAARRVQARAIALGCDYADNS
jgi:hypothetical protein